MELLDRFHLNYEVGKYINRQWGTKTPYDLPNIIRALDEMGYLKQPEKRPEEASQKPQMLCSVKIIGEHEKKTNIGICLYNIQFVAPEEIANQMKDFGYVCWEVDAWWLNIDPRFDYEEVKAYLLSLDEFPRTQCLSGGSQTCWP